MDKIHSDFLLRILDCVVLSYRIRENANFDDNAYRASLPLMADLMWQADSLRMFLQDVLKRQAKAIKES